MEERIKELESALSDAQHETSEQNKKVEALENELLHTRLMELGVRRKLESFRELAASLQQQIEGGENG